MQFLELLLGLEGELLSGCLCRLLTPEQTWLLVGEEGGAALILLDYLLAHDLMTWMFPLRGRALGLQAMLLRPYTEKEQSFYFPLVL